MHSKLVFAIKQVTISLNVATTAMILFPIALFESVPFKIALDSITSKTLHFYLMLDFN